MEGGDAGIPIIHQWIGYGATIAGTVLSLIGMLASVWAARKASNASSAADSAKQAVLKIVRASQVEDIVSEMYELEAMISRKDGEAIVMKTARIIGRIARFKGEAYTRLTAEENAALIDCTKNLEAVRDLVPKQGAKPDIRYGKIRTSYGTALAILSALAGTHRSSLVSGETHHG